MKEKTQHLVIFEEDNLVISVWKDYFSANYELSFLNFNTQTKTIKKYINKRTIFICNKNVNNDVIFQLKENNNLN